MSIHRRGRDWWRVVIYHHGKRKDFTVRGTKADAEALEASKLLELRSQTRHPDELPTFESFCRNEYKAGGQTGQCNATKTKQAYMMATLLSELGHLRLDEVSKNVSTYVQKRVDAKLSAVTINNELRVLRRVLNYARNELDLPIPPPKIRALRETKHRVKVWTDDEVNRLLASCQRTAPALYPLVVFLLNTGCRKGEALALQWSHVDFERRFVQIYPSEAWAPKNRQPREVPMSDGVVQLLSGDRLSAKWVFPSPATCERYVSFPQRQFTRAQRKAGLKGGPHTLRHTYASRFLRAVPDIFLLSQILGHSHQRTTALYTHLLPEHLERARNAVNVMAWPPALPAGGDNNDSPENEEPSRRAQASCGSSTVVSRKVGPPVGPDPKLKVKRPLEVQPRSLVRP